MDRELKVLRPPLRLRMLDLRDSIDHRWSEVLRHGIEQGVFDVEEPEVARLALIRTCTSVVHWYRSSGPRTVEELAQSIADLVLGAVRARRNGSPVRAASLSRPSVSDLHSAVRAALGKADWVQSNRGGRSRPSARR
jgi:hypothetical protein